MHLFHTTPALSSSRRRAGPDTAVASRRLGPEQGSKGGTRERAPRLPLRSSHVRTIVGLDCQRPPTCCGRHFQLRWAVATPVGMVLNLGWSHAAVYFPGDFTFLLLYISRAKAGQPARPTCRDGRSFRFVSSSTHFFLFCIYSHFAALSPRCERAVTNRLLWDTLLNKLGVIESVHRVETRILRTRTRN